MMNILLHLAVRHELRSVINEYARILKVCTLTRKFDVQFNNQFFQNAENMFKKCVRHARWFMIIVWLFDTLFGNDHVPHHALWVQEGQIIAKRKWILFFEVYRIISDWFLHIWLGLCFDWRFLFNWSSIIIAVLLAHTEMQ